MKIASPTKVEPTSFGELKVGDLFTISESDSVYWNIKVAPSVLVDGSMGVYNVIRVGGPNAGGVRTFKDTQDVDKLVE